MAGAVQRNVRFAIVVLVNGRHSFDSDPLISLCENMTSSTKAEIHHVLQ